MCLLNLFVFKQFRLKNFPKITLSMIFLGRLDRKIQAGVKKYFHSYKKKLKNL